MTNKERGFTLLEAIVALVLISTSGMALYAWLNSSIISLQKVEQAGERVLAQTSALQFMRNINPGETPTGSQILGQYQVLWKSTVLKELQEGVGYPAGTGLFTTGLFQTEVTIKKAGAVVGSFQLQQFGYKKVLEWEMPI